MKQQFSRLRFLPLHTLAASVGLVSIPRAVAIVAGVRRRHISLKAEGNPILPTLPNGEILKVDRTAYSHATPASRGIVTFPPPFTRP